MGNLISATTNNEKQDSDNEKPETKKKFGYKGKIDEENKNIITFQYKVKGQKHEAQIDVNGLTAEEIKERRIQIYHQYLYEQDLKPKLKEKRDIISAARKRIRKEKKERKQAEKQTQKQAQKQAKMLQIPS